MQKENEHEISIGDFKINVADLEQDREDVDEMGHVAQGHAQLDLVDAGQPLRVRQRHAVDRRRLLRRLLPDAADAAHLLAAVHQSDGKTRRKKTKI